MREYSQLPVKEFALVALLDDGTLQTFTSPSLQNENIGKTAAGLKNTLSRMVRRADPERSSILGGKSTLIPNIQCHLTCSTDSGESSHGHHKNRRFDDDGEMSGSSKRPRRRHGGRSNEEMLPPVPSRKTQTLQIDDSPRVEEFYKTRFKEMQQTACKTIGKVFVKLVEPKKQTHHPYTRGNESAPPWWPCTNQHTDPEHYVKHKEPDHLYKKGTNHNSHVYTVLTYPHRESYTPGSHPTNDRAAVKSAASLNPESWLDCTETRGAHCGGNEHLVQGKRTPGEQEEEGIP